MRAKTLFAAAFASLMLIGSSAHAQSFSGLNALTGLQGLGNSSVTTTSTARSPLGGLIRAELLPPLILLKTVKFLLTGAPPASPVCRGFFCR